MATVNDKQPNLYDSTSKPSAAKKKPVEDSKPDLRPEWLKAHDALFCGGKPCDCVACYNYKPSKIPKYLGPPDLDGNRYECANGCGRRFKGHLSAAKHMGLVNNVMGDCPQTTRRT